MISITYAKVVCIANDLRQVIIFGWDGEQTHVATYGESAVDSQQAAVGANVIKRGWGWPENLCTDTTRIQVLEARIAELESELRRVGNKE
jgi:hypothetical protein